MQAMPFTPRPRTPREERMFAIDAAGQQTYLTSRYYDEHAGDFNGQKMQLFTLPGETAMAPDPAYIAETVPLTVGTTTVQVHYIPVLTQPLGSAARDDVYGVAGRGCARPVAQLHVRLQDHALQCADRGVAQSFSVLSKRVTGQCEHCQNVPVRQNQRRCVLLSVVEGRRSLLVASA